ncbi:MAG: P-loop NTPase [Actinomycetota bacterium]|nr:P-loop NTPase [Actinomycetota bacterium]
MRIAVAGKGGAGKTTISATLARLLARSGAPVVAIDADSNPNLATALGVDREREGEPTTLPPSIVSRRLQGPALVEPVEDVLDHHTVRAPDGVRLTLMGMPAHANEGCLCSAHATVSAVLGDLGASPRIATIVDMEASPEHLSRGTARHVDVLLLVAEPYFRSLETVRRMAALAEELPIARLGVVANKVRSPADAEAIAEFCARHGFELVAQLPWSDAVVDADRAGVPLIEHADGAEVVQALAELAPRLLTAGQPAT